MADRPGYPRSLVMSRIRSTNTGPEVRLRSALHAMGVRFRLDQGVRIGPRRVVKPDLTFKKRRVVVFVDGCFWHGCATHCRMPQTNESYWSAKIQRNADRDRSDSLLLEELGWRVVRVWEHDDPAVAAARVAAVLSARKPL